MYAFKYKFEYFFLAYMHFRVKSIVGLSGNAYSQSFPERK